MIESFLDGSQTYMVVAMLLDAYIKQLIDGGCLKQKKRVEFTDDMEYIRFLKAEQVNMFMGAEYLLKNWDWKMTEVFNNATSNFGQITSNACMYGMVYKREDVRFFLTDLDVVIRDCRLEDETVKYSNGSVEYEPVKDVVLKFPNSEIKNFIAHDKKVIDVTAKIAVEVDSDQPIGVYFIDKRF